VSKELLVDVQAVRKVHSSAFLDLTIAFFYRTYKNYLLLGLEYRILCPKAKKGKYNRTPALAQQ